ncbi:MAG: type II secretion system minor pseudopilin GspJ [Xanthomonadales bacterium]|nr:type II secretion system minor pseudopilin GspJ [Xanthomonadales bacterium]
MSAAAGMAAQTRQSLAGARAGLRSGRRDAGRRSLGFTLIELLVALAIFAIMAGIAYAGLDAVSRSHAALDQRERELAALGRGLTVLERDLRSLARRSVRDGEGQSLPPLLAQAQYLELSSYGRGRAAGGDLGLIERQAYARDSDGLLRLRWPVLDRARSTVPEQRLLIPGIESLRWRFLDQAGQWHDVWPPPMASDANQPPRAAELELRHVSLGSIRRVVELVAVLP